MHNPQLFTSATGEHDTPADIVERIRYVFDGTIDLDPASSDRANRTIRAQRYYTEADDGLNQPWAARSIWLNPPYSVEKRDANGAPILSARTGKPTRQRVIATWVGRWLTSLVGVEHAALLVPARTDTTWFAPLYGMVCCFVSGRLTFGDADNGAPFPTAIFYHGSNVDRFGLVFAEVGVCGRFELLEN